MFTWNWIYESKGCCKAILHVVSEFVWLCYIYNIWLKFLKLLKWKEAKQTKCFEWSIFRKSKTKTFPSLDWWINQRVLLKNFKAPSSKVIVTSIHLFFRVFCLRWARDMEVFAVCNNVWFDALLCDISRKNQ